MVANIKHYTGIYTAHLFSSQIVFEYSYARCWEHDLELANSHCSQRGYTLFRKTDHYIVI